MLRRLLVLIVVLCVAPVSRSEERNEPLVLGDGYGEVVWSVSTSVVGADLQFVATYWKPISSYLKDEHSIVALGFMIDTDDDATTGTQSMPDEKRGTDVSVLAIVRPPLGKDAKTEEVVVTRENKVEKTAARLHVDKKTITVTVPLTELKIRKGDPIRLVLGVEGELLEQTITP
jgi:hypothetical protein